MVLQLVERGLLRCQFLLLLPRCLFRGSRLFVQIPLQDSRVRSGVQHDEVVVLVSYGGNTV